MLTQLGNELKRAREECSLSLQAVAIPAGISGAYLHKLERGTVENPSPRVLRQLAKELAVPYLRLLKLAGYLDDSEIVEISGKAPKGLLIDQELSAAEWKAVSAFIETLKSRRAE